ncbi:hypothetical protein [Spirosoma utsteinense]|uniref:Uncharacterized protein n=1 Tax=Spirosoma utsteinense TaxID=2585773 RepID=A0ABR6VZX6_9BACT|nr:hypothetical protein [Spirosoma utsteinense]MBC3786529.1 hypothetical protein [Spirosoma utsteinense]MBC3789907.1 hypothetical protein [Spirosoma utsteinense]
MNGLDQNLTPYLIAQGVSVLFLLAAWHSTRLARLLFALLFIGASGTNFFFGLTNPAIYQTYAAFAISPYRAFISGWFSSHSGLIVPVIATGQLLIGIGMLLNGAWVRWASIGAILFLLNIIPLLVGSGFPFSLVVAWAAWIVLSTDSRAYLWQAAPVTPNVSPPLSQLASIVAILAAITSITSLFFSQLYRDNTFVKTVWHANDWVTVGLSVTTLLCITLAKRQPKARLIVAGLLGYFVYNYAFYLVGAAFNVLFLLYVGIVALGLVALIGLLVSLPVYSLRPGPNGLRYVAVYLAGIALMLLLVELPPIGRFLTTGILPDMVIKSAHPTSIVYALDLSLIVPACLLGAVWLWQRKPWGPVVAAIMLVKGVAYGLVLCAGALLLVSRGIGTDPLLAFYVVLVLGGRASLVVLFKALAGYTPSSSQPHTLAAANAPVPLKTHQLPQTTPSL